MELLLWSAILGLIPAYIASNKGRSFGTWYLYGFLLFLIALIHSICLTSYKGKVKCPHCFGLVDERATVCMHCGRSLVETEA